MKGKISLEEFIKQVKDDLRAAVDEEDPFFFMDSVNLEVSFGLEAEAGGKGKFVVFDLSSKVKAEQTHKVTLSLTPFLRDEGPESPKGSGQKSKTRSDIKRLIQEAEGRGLSTRSPTAKRGSKSSPRKAAAKKTQTARKKAVQKKAARKKSNNKAKQ